jgi:uncharacterized membrane protein
MADDSQTTDSVDSHNVADTASVDSHDVTDTTSVEELFSQLRDVTTTDTDAETRAEIADVKQLLREAHDRGLIDSEMRDLQARDAAQAFVGSVIFASPLLVEDGIFDIGSYLFESTIADIPVFLIANTVFVVFMTYALLEWTGRNTEDTHLIAGVVPVRLFVVLSISFLVAAALMTVWGRVGGWQSPTEALARINVIWTVGSLGAALGDIVSDSDSGMRHQSHEPMHEQAGTSAGDKSMSDSALVVALHEEFDELEATVEAGSNQREIQRIREQTIQAALDDAFGTQIRKYTSRDIAEALVGSVFFSIPFLVEDGVFDVAEFFLSFRVESFPVFFLANTVFVLGMILALVYWAGPQDVQVSRPLLGFIPRRLVGIAVVSFLTSAALMTMWGRVDTWQDPVVAIARISVVWTVASFGAALGDILPGESSGDDINDDLRSLGDYRE